MTSESLDDFLSHLFSEQSSIRNEIVSVLVLFLSQLNDNVLNRNDYRKNHELQKLINNFLLIESQSISRSEFLINKEYFESLYPFFSDIKKEMEVIVTSLFHALSEFNKAIKDNLAENEIKSINFNALKQFEINEPIHSRLLAKLLNPKADHGQGNKFLIEFLKLLQIENPEDGTWHVTTETGRIDILLKRFFPESIIVIENKSNWANDQPNQLYRYWYREIYSRTKQTCETFYKSNGNKYKIIYLPPNEYKVPESHSYSKPKGDEWNIGELPELLPLPVEIKSYRTFIVQWLENCLMTLNPANHRMIEYINQYIEICRTL